MSWVGEGCRTNSQTMKVPRIAFFIVKSLSGPCDSILAYLQITGSILVAKTKASSLCITIPIRDWNKPRYWPPDAIRDQNMSSNNSSPRSQTAIGPTWGSRRMGGNIIQSYQFLHLLRELSWGLVNTLKILSWGPLRFSTIGRSILRTINFWLFWPTSTLDQFIPLRYDKYQACQKQFQVYIFWCPCISLISAWAIPFFL